MSVEVLETLICETLSTVASRVEFCWHGGEPLLAGRDFFVKAITFQNQYKLPSQIVINSIQTNGTLVDDEWIDFFETNGFGAGVSLDGPSVWHNRQRPFINGGGSHAQVMQTIRLWQARGQSVPVLCVVTSATADKAHELFSFFINAGIRDIDFLPCFKTKQMEGNAFDNVINARAFTDFMIEMFDLWWRADDPAIRIRYFENVLQGLFGGQPTLCKFAGTCNHFVTIDTDGTVWPCDSFMGEKKFAFGNILDTKLKGILTGERRLKFVANSTKVNRKCTHCKWFRMCKGGCTYYRYMQRGRFDDKDYYCPARIFEHIRRAAYSTASSLERVSPYREKCPIGKEPIGPHGSSFHSTSETSV
jgi:uncharacterized protein